MWVEKWGRNGVGGVAGEVGMRTVGSADDRRQWGLVCYWWSGWEKIHWRGIGDLSTEGEREGLLGENS